MYNCVLFEIIVVVVIVIIVNFGYYNGVYLYFVHDENLLQINAKISSLHRSYKYNVVWVKGSSRVVRVV